jgi:hypothetical protein
MGKGHMQELEEVKKIYKSRIIEKKKENKSRKT